MATIIASETDPSRFSTAPHRHLAVHHPRAQRPHRCRRTLGAPPALRRTSFQVVINTPGSPGPHRGRVRSCIIIRARHGARIRPICAALADWAPSQAACALAAELLRRWRFQSSARPGSERHQGLSLVREVKPSGTAGTEPLSIVYIDHLRPRLSHLRRRFYPVEAWCWWCW